jgi:hypothetical protein
VLLGLLPPAFFKGLFGLFDLRESRLSEVELFKSLNSPLDMSLAFFDGYAAVGSALFNTPSVSLVRFSA